MSVEDVKKKLRRVWRTQICENKEFSALAEELSKHGYVVEHKHVLVIRRQMFPHWVWRASVERIIRRSKEVFEHLRQD